MKNLQKLLVVGCFALPLSICLSSCARSRSAPIVLADKSPFQVSVSAGGKQVADLEAKLIHRLVYSPSESTRVDALKVKVERDREGGVMGLRVKNVGESSLGLEVGDLITAIHLKRVQGERDLESLKQSVRRGEDISMTVERESVAQKIYLSPK